jgi:hypothetical protein
LSAPIFRANHPKDTVSKPAPVRPRLPFHPEDVARQRTGEVLRLRVR